MYPPESIDNSLNKSGSKFSLEQVIQLKKSGYGIKSYIILTIQPCLAGIKMPYDELWQRWSWLWFCEAPFKKTKGTIFGKMKSNVSYLCRHLFSQCQELWWTAVAQRASKVRCQAELQWQLRAGQWLLCCWGCLCSWHLGSWYLDSWYWDIWCFGQIGYRSG